MPSIAKREDAEHLTCTCLNHYHPCKARAELKDLLDLAEQARKHLYGTASPLQTEIAFKLGLALKRLRED